MFISVWAIIFLGIMAYLFHIDSQYLGHFTTTHSANAKTCLWGFIVYIVFLGLCGYNMWYHKKNPFPAEEDEDAGKKEVFTSIVRQQQKPSK